MDETDSRHRFEAMYRHTYEQILGYAMRRCSSPEDAADVVAETYVIAWRRIGELPRGEAATRLTRVALSPACAAFLPCTSVA